MSIANFIILATILVAVFWVLHIYAVHRARYLVKLELESLSGSVVEREQTIDVDGRKVTIAMSPLHSVECV
jgi:hypothetical protein